MYKESKKSILKSIPQTYKNCTLETIEGNGLKEIGKQYVENYPSQIVLFGPTGTGKTHLSCAIYQKLYEQNKIESEKFLFITAPEFLLEIRKTYESDSEKHEADIIDKYSKCELLILDDLGSEKTSEFAVQALYLLIDRRIRNMKSTIITTNLSLEQIEEKLDARIASRLAGMKVVKINLPDYRKRR